MFGIGLLFNFLYRFTLFFYILLSIYYIDLYHKLRTDVSFIKTEIKKITASKN